MNQRAVIFDLDGTLLDSLADIAAAANRALAALGLPGHDTEAYRRMVGSGADVLMQRALPDDQQTLLRSALERFREHYRSGMLDHTAPYEGVPQLLDRLSERGVPMAVLSNKPDAAAQQIVATLLGRWTWSAVAGHRADVPKKPDPVAATRMAEKLGVEPADCLFVGDSAVDMQTAVNAGMRPIGVLWGFRDRGELIEHGAAELLEQPLELLDHLAEDTPTG
jgi:phosphoglycolate phosphatase